MVSRKIKVNDEMLPHCKDCKFGEFGARVGECHYYPMDWVVIKNSPAEGIEGGTFPMWRPAEENGYCSFFQRKVH